MGASSFIRRCLVGDIASNVRNQIRSRRSRRMPLGGHLQTGRRSYPASAFLGTLAVALTGVHRCVPWQPPSSRRRLGKSASAGKPCYSGFPQFDFLYDTFTLDLRDSYQLGLRLPRSLMFLRSSLAFPPSHGGKLCGDDILLLLRISLYVPYSQAG